KVIYNLGVMNEVVGNYRQAEELYEMAYQLKDEGYFEKALKRVRKNVRFCDALAEIGIEITEHDFSASVAEKARALANKAKIKGDSNKRKAVYAEPDPGSEVVVRVPGGLMFTVLKKQGDWLLLELLGGKRGFIHKKNVELK
ncbi:hypothetical protein KAH55_05870, partial [bacterium]|nr:hypothetical protein [bacterium]